MMNSPSTYSLRTVRAGTSSRGVAQELELPVLKATEICWCLDRRFYAPGQVHYRRTRASLDAFKGLVADGMTMRPDSGREGGAACRADSGRQ
jgi:hypothetical protein